MKKNNRRDLTFSIIIIVFIFSIGLLFVTSFNYWSCLWIVMDIFLSYIFAIWHINYLKAKIFSRRQSLSDDDIYNKFYYGTKLPKNKVLSKWKMVSKILKIPADKLLPTDKFGEELGPYWFVGDPLDELEIIAKRNFKANGIDGSKISIRNLDEYIKMSIQLDENNQKNYLSR